MLARRVAARWLGPGRVAQSGNIVLQVFADGERAAATFTNDVAPARGDFAILNLPNGDTVLIATSLEAMKTGTPGGLTKLELEALFNAGLIETDDGGNYVMP